MTEFKDALDDMLYWAKVGHATQPRGKTLRCLDESYNNIHRALRIADRLMGEPSRNVINALNGFSVGHDLLDVATRNFSRGRDQLLREIEQEQHH